MDTMRQFDCSNLFHVAFSHFPVFSQKSKIEHSKAAFVIAVSTGWEVSSPVWIVSVRDWEQSECRLWYVRTSPAPLSRTVQREPRFFFSSGECLNAVKLYTTEYYEMLLIVTISTVEKEKKKKKTKQNNIKIKREQHSTIGTINSYNISGNFHLI